MIEYQNKIYQLRKEELIGLYFYHLKRQIEKEYIIKEITITTNNIHIDENIIIKSFLLIDINKSIIINSIQQEMKEIIKKKKKRNIKKYFFFSHVISQNILNRFNNKKKGENYKLFLME